VRILEYRETTLLQSMASADSFEEEDSELSDDVDIQGRDYLSRAPDNAVAIKVPLELYFVGVHPASNAINFKGVDNVTIPPFWPGPGDRADARLTAYRMLMGLPADRPWMPDMDDVVTHLFVKGTEERIL